MEYYVTRSLKHNDKEYSRGECIDLADESTISDLVEAGVIQTEPIADAAVAPAPELDAAPQPDIGGKAMETGSPSIDGEPERGEDKAEDITPKETGTEPEEGQEAVEATEAKADAEEGPKTAPKRRMRALSPDTKDEHDPSAGL